jgi:hypothetical protein
MPQAIAVVAGAIGSAAAGLATAAGASAATATTIATTVTAVAQTAISLGLTIAINAAFAPKLPGLPAVQVPIKQAIPNRRTGYGRARLSGAYMLFEAHKAFSVDVLAVHDGRINAITNYYLHDDEVFLDADGHPDQVAPGKYSNDSDTSVLITFLTRLGLPTETAYPEVIAKMPGLWTTDHRGDGIASIALLCKQAKDTYQPKRYPNGLPQPSIAGELSLVYDPRDPAQVQSGPSTWAWSENPILHLLDYLTSTEHGMGLDYERRILPRIGDWIAAANDCETTVPLKAGGTEPRYRCGGVFEHATAPADVVNQIVSTCDGWLAQTGSGALTVQSGRYRAPTVTLTDDHVTGYTLKHFVTDEEAVNVLLPTYTDRAKGYTENDAGAYRNEADITARGRERSQPFPLPWVPSPTQARRLAKRKMSRLAAELSGTMRTNLYGMNVLGERYVRLQITENDSLNDIVVEVSRVEFDLQNMGVTFDWVLADENIDDWDPTTEEIDLPNPADRVSPADLVAPTITDVEPLYPRVAKLIDGAQLKVTVEPPADIGEPNWKLRWRVSGQTLWSEWPFVTDIDFGDPVELVTGFVAADATVEIQAAYQTAQALSPWSASATYTLDAPETSIGGGGGSTYSPNLIPNPTAQYGGQGWSTWSNEVLDLAEGGWAAFKLGTATSYDINGQRYAEFAVDPVGFAFKPPYHWLGIRNYTGGPTNVFATNTQIPVTFQVSNTEFIPVEEGADYTFSYYARRDNVREDGYYRLKVVCYDGSGAELSVEAVSYILNEGGVGIAEQANVFVENTFTTPVGCTQVKVWTDTSDFQADTAGGSDFQIGGPDYYCRIMTWDLKLEKGSTATRDPAVGGLATYSDGTPIDDLKPTDQGATRNLAFFQHSDPLLDDPTLLDGSVWYDNTDPTAIVERTLIGGTWVGPSFPITLASTSLTASGLVARFVADRPFTLKAGFADGAGYTATGPSAGAVYTVKRNVAAIGTATFAAGAHTPTLSAASDTAFAVGDRLELWAPSSLNGMTDVTLSLRGYL